MFYVCQPGTASCDLSNDRPGGLTGTCGKGKPSTPVCCPNNAAVRPSFNCQILESGIVINKIVGWKRRLFCLKAKSTVKIGRIARGATAHDYFCG